MTSVDLLSRLNHYKLTPSNTSNFEAGNLQVPAILRLEILRVPAILRLEILRVPAILRLEICRCQRFWGWKSAGASDFEAESWKSSKCRRQYKNLILNKFLDIYYISVRHYKQLEINFMLECFHN